MNFRLLKLFLVSFIILSFVFSTYTSAIENTIINEIDNDNSVEINSDDNTSYDELDDLNNNYNDVEFTNNIVEENSNEIDTEIETKEEEQNVISDDSSDEEKDETTNNEIETKVLSDNIEKNNKKSIVTSSALKSSVQNTLSDGEYFIRSSKDRNKVLSVVNGSLRNTAKIELITNRRALQSRFKVVYLGDGYYKIESIKSGKVFDVPCASKDIGTKLNQYDFNGTDAQKWILKKNTNGSYSIVSKCSGLYLDLPCASVDDGTQIQLYTGNGTIAQDFIFEPITHEVGEKILDDGVYAIKSKKDSSRAITVKDNKLDNCSNVVLADYTRNYSQRFSIKYLGDGCYSIMVVGTNKSLDVECAGLDNCSNVQIYDSNLTNAQKWIIRHNANNTYSIISKCNDLFIDLPCGMIDNGTNIQVYEGNGTAAQQYIFEEIAPVQLENGIYEISTCLDRNMNLDVSGGSKLNSANIQIWQGDNVTQQKFKIEKCSDGYYIIKACHSGKVLDVEWAGKVSGTNVQQYDYNGSDAQKWEIVETEEGAYTFKSKCNGLYLDVAAGRTSCGTNIWVYEKNDTKAQKFYINKTSIREYKGIDVSAWNPDIDWEKVKYNSDVDFAILRTAFRGYTAGGIFMDSTFLYNIAKTKVYNIDIGLYFFSQAINEREAIEEANYVLNLIKKYNIDVKYPIVIDTEYSGSTTNGVNDYDGRADRLSREERTNVCKAFCNTINNAGYCGMIYANRDWFYNNLDMNQLSQYDIWLAHYTTKTDFKYNYDMWQYTSKGSVPGISGYVDMNICYKKY